MQQNMEMPEQININDNETKKILKMVDHTSTGFSTSGATFKDVELMKKHIGKNVKVKAAGGISSFEDADKFISLGADRLGTSRLVKIKKNMNIC